VCDPATVRFVRGVGTLLHEVWLTDEESAREAAARTGHSAAGEVADLARRARVRRLLPVHHHPRRSGEELVALAAELRRRSELEVELAIEGMPLELGR